MGSGIINHITNVNDHNNYHTLAHKLCWILENTSKSFARDHQSCSIQFNSIQFQFNSIQFNSDQQTQGISWLFSHPLINQLLSCLQFRCNALICFTLYQSTDWISHHWIQSCKQNNAKHNLLTNSQQISILFHGALQQIASHANIDGRLHLISSQHPNTHSTLQTCSNCGRNIILQLVFNG